MKILTLNNTLLVLSTVMIIQALLGFDKSAYYAAVEFCFAATFIVWVLTKEQY